MEQMLGAMPSKSRAAFVRHTHDTQQAIIRQIDAKAGMFITLLVFMLIGLAPVARDVVTKLHWHGKGAMTSWLYVASGALFVLSVLITAWRVYDVIRPRGYSDRELAGGLVFADALLIHPGHQAYANAVMNTTDNLLLINSIGQIYQLSEILKEKIDALNRAGWPVLLAFTSWTLNTVISIYVFTWR